MASEKELGYVYILTNPSFKEDWVKIGKSSRPVDVRSKELDNTAVPMPFDIYATLKTCKFNEVEKLVHKTIDRLTDLRIRQNREFFNVQPSVALDILKDIALTLEDAEICMYDKSGEPHVIFPCTEPVPEKIINYDDEIGGSAGTRRTRFKFSMVGIEFGEELEFIPTGIKVRVISDDQIEYQDRIYKLSPFVGTFMPVEKQNTSGAYQGAKYFSYKGKVLADLRKEVEKSD